MAHWIRAQSQKSAYSSSMSPRPKREWGPKNECTPQNVRESGLKIAFVSFYPLRDWSAGIDRPSGSMGCLRLKRFSGNKREPHVCSVWLMSTSMFYCRPAIGAAIPTSREGNTFSYAARDSVRQELAGRCVGRAYRTFQPPKMHHTSTPTPARAYLGVSQRTRLRYQSTNRYPGDLCWYIH